MRTFDDFTAAKNKGEFCAYAVDEFRSTPEYAEAKTAEAYSAKHNVTIENFQKKLRTLSGATVPDIFSTNYKIKSLVFPRLVTQQALYVLSNGVKLLDMDNKDKLGKSFDYKLQKLARKALVGGQAFGFWNYDHLEVFGFAETKTDPGFCPLYDSKTGALRAGIRFWRRKIGDKYVSFFTLYEEDGYTEYTATDEGKVTAVEEKRPYIQTSISTIAGGVEAVIGENYSSLPIVPLYANDNHQSELVGIREAIDCYDLVKSGFANDIDDANGFYWLLKNTGGMDDADLALFLQRMKSLKAAAIDADEGVDAEAHTIDIPVTARETLLDRLERDIYKDYQGLDVSSLSAAAKTAQEIQAAYQPMDNKCAMFEYELIEFMDKVLALAGMPDEEVSFTWNKITNMTEQTNMVLSAGNLLSEECIISHLPFLTPEEAAAEIEKRAQGDYQQFSADEE